MVFGGISEPEDFAAFMAACRRHRPRSISARGRKIDHGIGKREFAFPAAKLLVGFGRGARVDQRLRVGKADIFDRHAHEAACQKTRILAGIDHAAEVIEGSVGIGAAHRFVQGRDQVVMPVLGLVVDRARR